MTDKKNLQLICYWCRIPFKTDDKIVEEIIKGHMRNGTTIIKALVHEDCYK